MSKDREDTYRMPLSGTKTTDHPMWPDFKHWAEENVPGCMLDVYWQAFLAGAGASRRFEVNALLAGAKPSDVVPQIAMREGQLVVDGEVLVDQGGRMTNVTYKPVLADHSPTATFADRLDIVTRVLALRHGLVKDGYSGPFIARIPRAIDLDARFYTNRSNLSAFNGTLRDRLLQIDGIVQVQSYGGLNLEVQQLPAGTGG